MPLRTTQKHVGSQHKSSNLARLGLDQSDASLSVNQDILIIGMYYIVINASPVPQVNLMGMSNSELSLLSAVFNEAYDLSGIQQFDQGN